MLPQLRSCPKNVRLRVLRQRTRAGTWTQGRLVLITCQWEGRGGRCETCEQEVTVRMNKWRKNTRARLYTACLIVLNRLRAFRWPRFTAYRSPSTPLHDLIWLFVLFSFLPTSFSTTQATVIQQNAPIRRYARVCVYTRTHVRTYARSTHTDC